MSCAFTVSKSKHLSKWIEVVDISVDIFSRKVYPSNSLRPLCLYAAQNWPACCSIFCSVATVGAWWRMQLYLKQCKLSNTFFTKMTAASSDLPFNKFHPYSTNGWVVCCDIRHELVESSGFRGCHVRFHLCLWCFVSLNVAGKHHTFNFPLFSFFPFSQAPDGNECRMSSCVGIRATALFKYCQQVYKHACSFWCS